MTLRLARDAEAAEMLHSPEFRSQWLRLYRECPWATAAQSPGFVTSWYASYADDYRPLLVVEASTSNTLTGFLPLGLHRSGRAVLPGAHQAEYKSWLALPSNGAAFIEAALQILSREAHMRAVAFRYLPSGTPIDRIGVAAGSGWFHEIETHQRPVVPLESAKEVAEYLRQKTNRTIRNSWSRLKRMGNVQLEQVRECEELIPIFDRLIEWYDVRQEIAHGKRPFQADKNKKPWHLMLLKEGVLHLTLLKVGEEVVSAIFGLSDGKTYSVMMPAFSPDYAQYSPIGIQHLMLVEKLHAEGYRVLDLTPGPDPFKDRFAATYETVSALSVYFQQREWVKAKVRQRSRAIVKGMLGVFGIAPTRVIRALPRILSLLRGKRTSGPNSPTTQRV